MEKLRLIGLFPGIGGEGFYWECWVFNHQPTHMHPDIPTARVTAETAPLAICRAALLTSDTHP